MIDLELERKAFNDWHFLTYGEFVNWWDDAPASWIHNDRWKGWISSAESKQAEIDSLKAQLAKVGSGEFVVVPKDQLYQWGHMANYAQEYGCPECFEARGYAHNLACEINEYLKPVDAAQENSHE